MFKILCLSVVLCLISINESFAAQAIMAPVPKPPEFANQEGCYHPNLKTVLSYDVPFYTSECSRLTCKTNGNIIISTCGVLQVLEGQRLLKGNKSLPYPHCCDSVQ